MINLVAAQDYGHCHEKLKSTLKMHGIARLRSTFTSAVVFKFVVLSCLMLPSKVSLGNRMYISTPRSMCSSNLQPIEARHV